MIQASIISFWKGLNFETGAEVAKISMRLPGGLLVDVAVPPEYLQQLVAATEEKELPAPIVLQNSVQAPPAPLEEEPQDDGTGKDLLPVRWAPLPTDLLPNHVKLAMQDLELPEHLLVAQILQIRDSILAEYRDADWSVLDAKHLSEEAVVPPRVETPQPVAAGLVWGEGSVMRPSIPSRTVPRDAQGYPIVSQRTNGVDPGEVSASTDDDGVSQF